MAELTLRAYNRLRNKIRKIDGNLMQLSDEEIQQAVKIGLIEGECLA